MITQHEAPLPRELANLGQPLGVHRVRAASTCLLCMVAGVVFLLAAGLCVVLYFKAPFKKDDPTPPETMLYVAAGVGVAGLAFLMGAWWNRDKRGGSGKAYLVYRDALVLLDDESCLVMPWHEVTALLSPDGMGDYRLQTEDGQTVPIRRNVQGYSDLIASVAQRVSQEIIPPLRHALETGRTVSFGPFEMSTHAIGYKGKTLAWDEVAVVRLEIGQLGRRLRIRASGSLLPWCFCNLNTVPNGVFFPELLRTVCPARLLVAVPR